MNKSDLVAALADTAGMTKADASRSLDSLFGSGGIIATALRAGQRVQITGFGTFEAKYRRARMGRNPRTGATIHIPASKSPGFRAGKGFKDGIQ